MGTRGISRWAKWMGAALCATSLLAASPAALAQGKPEKSKVTIAVGGKALSVFTTIATLGTPQDITLQEVRIECFFPADERSDALFRSLAAKS